MKTANVSAWLEYTCANFNGKNKLGPQYSGLLMLSIKFSSIQSLSRVQLFVTPWSTACQASLSFTNSRSLCKLMSIEWMIASNHLILCHPLLLPPSIFPSMRVFSNESVLLIRSPKYWSFNFNVRPSSEHSETALQLLWSKDHFLDSHRLWQPTVHLQPLNPVLSLPCLLFCDLLKATTTFGRMETKEAACSQEIVIRIFLNHLTKKQRFT